MSPANICCLLATLKVSNGRDIERELFRVTTFPVTQAGAYATVERFFQIKTEIHPSMAGHGQEHFFIRNF